ncbi:unnamed protein product (macronuclear) [Paramecium tetraurelia]|uniref:Flagellar FliJ protein n=1 Tax=Paramecium tetraurelia TaxID=5888 RepID=A0C1D9_PARTE|nr:uncharacterized protein GSPATT00034082001 [Paramecium tetraurelia]CAK64606.1 unnamed protein product [Paramecium tetraurelia]|eukprot:XP_001432004.1 hypothetical protein (macronuclear) [Paramecium tetraurelia strain d4-2]
MKKLKVELNVAKEKISKGEKSLKQKAMKGGLANFYQREIKKLSSQAQEKHLDLKITNCYIQQYQIEKQAEEIVSKIKQEKKQNFILMKYREQLRNGSTKIAKMNSQGSRMDIDIF